MSPKGNEVPTSHFLVSNVISAVAYKLNQQHSQMMVLYSAVWPPQRWDIAHVQYIAEWSVVSAQMRFIWSLCTLYTVPLNLNHISINSSKLDQHPACFTWLSWAWNRQSKLMGIRGLQVVCLEESHWFFKFFLTFCVDSFSYRVQ